METLLDILEKESETAIKFFKRNEMIVNPDKFESTVLGGIDKKKQLIWKLMEQK